MDYKKRIIDDQLDLELESFGATLITGPKGCGKTTSAKQKAKSYIEFQDEDQRDNLLAVADVAPSKLLIGDKPRLFDEWQDAPKLWGAIRKSVDDLGENGLYILTGSSSRDVYKPHTGTLRISQLKMLPMSLYESGESNGAISLIDLFNNPDAFTECISDLDIDGLIFAICRGGWPKALTNKTERSQLEVARDLYRQTYSIDISNIDGVKRNPRLAQAILQSYSRNLCTLATTKTILDGKQSPAEILQKLSSGVPDPGHPLPPNGSSDGSAQNAACCPSPAARSRRPPPPDGSARAPATIL